MRVMIDMHDKCFRGVDDEAVIARIVVYVCECCLHGVVARVAYGPQTDVVCENATVCVGREGERDIKDVKGEEEGAEDGPLGHPRGHIARR